MELKTLLLGLLGLAAARIVGIVYFALTSPTRSIPGPFWARFTSLWYLHQVAGGHFEVVNKALHRRYGPVVRLGPSRFSFDSFDAVNKIYGVSSKMPKSDWYSAFKHPDPSRWTLFADADIARHNQQRRIFQPLYSMSSLVSYEGYVDQCADLLQAHLSEAARRRDPGVDMNRWFQCYAYDVIGNMTFSKRLGFLDRGEDIGGLLQAGHGALVYSTLVGIYASWHPLLHKVSCWFNSGGAVMRNHLAAFVGAQIGQRKKALQASADANSDTDTDNHIGTGPTAQDFLQKLMNKAEQDGPTSKITDFHLFALGLSNITAGSDTTASSLSGVLYHLLKNPAAMAKLRAEVDAAAADGRFAGEHLAYKHSLEMPYLQAVIKEGMRVHSVTGLPMWRVVPAGGVEIAGTFLPEGSHVGINPWCAHANQDVFGEDAAVFRPERWLEADGETLSRMNIYFLPFGSGSRTCTGRHVSFLEMSKLVPLLVKKYDFELVSPDREWRTTNFWFVKPQDFRVTIKERQQ